MICAGYPRQPEGNPGVRDGSKRLGSHCHTHTDLRQHHGGGRGLLHVRGGHFLSQDSSEGPKIRPTDVGAGKAGIQCGQGMQARSVNWLNRL